MWIKFTGVLCYKHTLIEAHFIAELSLSNLSNGKKNNMAMQERGVRELQEAITSGELKIAQLMQETQAAMENRRDINAVISTDTESIMRQVREQGNKLEQGEKLPLHGIPFLVKDNIDTVDFHTTGGTQALADHLPGKDAGVVQRLKQAGAIIVGKANMHELAFGITSNNGWSGPVRNPWNTDMIAGGSSGGSAAAVAAGMVPVSLGSDTGGSNRIPASLCGVVGFRPSTGRYPGDGLINLSLTRDTVGIFAHKVDDIVLVDDVLAGGARKVSLELQKLRLAVPADPFYKALEKETAEVMEKTLATIEAAGASLVKVDMPDLFSLNEKMSMAIAVFETLRELADYLQRNNIGINLEQLVAAILSPDVKHIMQASMNEQKVPGDVYLEAINVHRPLLQQMYADFFAENRVDAILYPTTPLTARPIGQDETIEINGQQMPTFPSFVRNGDPSSNAGIPSLSIPAGIAANGLPVGLCIDGPATQNEEVLAIGSAIQAILPAIASPNT